MTTAEKYQEVAMDRQNEVELRLMKGNKEYRELRESIIKLESMLIAKGEDTAKLLRERELAELRLYSILGQALYRAGFEDGLTMTKGY